MNAPSRNRRSRSRKNCSGKNRSRKNCSGKNRRTSRRRMRGGGDPRLKHDYPGASQVGMEFDVDADTKDAIRTALGRAEYADEEYDMDLRVLEENLVWMKENDTDGFEELTGDWIDDQGASDVDELALQATSNGYPGNNADKQYLVRNAGAIRYYAQMVAGRNPVAVAALLGSDSKLKEHA